MCRLDDHDRRSVADDLEALRAILPQAAGRLAALDDGRYSGLADSLMAGCSLIERAAQRIPGLKPMMTRGRCSWAPARETYGNDSAGYFADLHAAARRHAVEIDDAVRVRLADTLDIYDLEREHEARAVSP